MALADMDKSKKIKLGFAVAALLAGGVGVAYTLGMFEPKVVPGTASAGINAPLETKPELTEQEKVEQEAADAELKETIKNQPSSGS